MKKRELVIFSLLIISILFIAGCQQAVGGTKSTRIREDQGMRYNLISPDKQDTTTVTLSSNLNNNCDPPIGTFAYGSLNGVPNTCIKVLGCIQISAQATSTINDDHMVLSGLAQPILAAAVYGREESRCLSTDIVILPSTRPLIDTGLSGF